MALPRNNQSLLYLLFVFLFILAGCSTAPQSPVKPQLVETKQSIPLPVYAELGKRPEFPSEKELFQLSADQLNDLDAYWQNPKYQTDDPHQRLANYIKQFIDNFNYHSDTLMASEVAAVRQGNCLSLAIYSTALANQVNVDISYELMHSQPVFQRIGNTLLSSEHIRSVLYKPLKPEDWQSDIFFQPIIRIDYFPESIGYIKRRVPMEEFVSMYFRNLAAEAIIDKRFTDAYWLTRESLEYAKDDPNSINVMALVYDRLGYKKDAENLYLYGIKNVEEKVDLYTNYRNFLLKQKRFTEASRISDELSRLDGQNPFDWLELADAALAKGQLNNAEKYYEKFIKLAPYLHQGYSGKAKVAFMRGHMFTAQNYFNQALERTFNDDTKTLYESKLNALLSYSF